MWLEAMWCGVCVCVFLCVSQQVTTSPIIFCFNDRLVIFSLSLSPTLSISMQSVCMLCGVSINSFIVFFFLLHFVLLKVVLWNCFCGLFIVRDVFRCCCCCGWSLFSHSPALFVSIMPNIDVVIICEFKMNTSRYYVCYLTHDSWASFAFFLIN